MKLSPGNPVDKILHLDVSHVSAEQINATEEKLGLRIQSYRNGGNGCNNCFN